jgi:hypothetical protein
MTDSGPQLPVWFDAIETTSNGTLSNVGEARRLARMLRDDLLLILAAVE